MTPLRYTGNGDFSAANAYHARALDKALVIGEVLTWERMEARSTESHNHYFAAIHEAWINLPETVAGEFPNPESLRKYALIKAGYCTVKKVACLTASAANELTTYLLSIDSFLLCEVYGNVATVYRAQSQSMKAMGKKEFQKSKQAVLDILSSMIGAEVKEDA